MDKFPKAIHLGTGNYFDNIMIDIQASFEEQDNWLNHICKHKTRHNFLINNFSILLDGLLIKVKLLEPLVTIGFRKKWFELFQNYWTNILNGRALNIMDFHNLRFLYRRNFQSINSLDWSTYNKHLENWQNPRNISTIFMNSYNMALNPLSGYRICKYIKKGMRILEYGCSLAPVYATYKKYFNHKKAKWVLADIPNFSYHYARYCYAFDTDIENMLVIEPEIFNDPLRNVEKFFDIIIVRQVFEHLHNPRGIAEYLLGRLKSKGLFIFDYVLSKAHGLDSLAGLEERIPTLEYLLDNLEIIEGKIEQLENSIGLCVGIKG
jgi:SAM-dependent methyltransferase